jgi:hypothetical protein
VTDVTVTAACPVISATTVVAMASHHARIMSCCVLDIGDVKPLRPSPVRAANIAVESLVALRAIAYPFT